MPDLKSAIAKVAQGTSLSKEEARSAFTTIMAGEATDAQIGAFLMALRVRGETVDEIAGAVSVMRKNMTRVQAPEGAIDIVGTGGDSSGSYNISTAAALVAAGAGAKVAKHGNRAISSKSGAADALESLGVNLSGGPDFISRCISEAGVGFMFAPNHHAAMRHVGPARTEMGVRTVLNLLGPLSNPAGVTRQVVGVYAPQWLEPLAHVLKSLGSKHALVVHGDGMDELTVTANTQIAELKDGHVTTYSVSPQDFGLPLYPIADLKGGDASVNAAAMTRLLEGERGAYRDVTVLNAAAGLYVAGIADDLATGIEKACVSIDSGAARHVLKTLIETASGEDA